MLPKDPFLVDTLPHPWTYYPSIHLNEKKSLQKAGSPSSSKFRSENCIKILNCLLTPRVCRAVAFTEKIIYRQWPKGSLFLRRPRSECSGAMRYWARLYIICLWRSTVQVLILRVDAWKKKSKVDVMAVVRHKEDICTSRAMMSFLPDYNGPPARVLTRRA